MKDCVIIVGSAFRDESNFDFIKNSKEDHVDIISIDYIANVLLEDTNENINGKNFNIYRRNIDMRDLENLNKLKDLLKEKGPYEKIIILDSIHFDKKFEYSKPIADQIINKVFPGHDNLYQIHYISPKCKTPTLNGEFLKLTSEIVDNIKKNGEDVLALGELDNRQKNAIRKELERMLDSTTIMEFYDSLDTSLYTWNKNSFAYKFFEKFKPKIIETCNNYYQNHLMTSLEKIDLEVIKNLEQDERYEQAQEKIETLEIISASSDDELQSPPLLKEKVISFKEKYQQQQNDEIDQGYESPNPGKK